MIGEYGDSLLRGGNYEEEELVKEVKESDIVDLFNTILNSSYGGQIVTEYIVTSAMKLTTRLSDPAQVERIRRLLQNHTRDLDIEVQQRSVEYGNLFAYDQVRRGVLEKMPAPEIREAQRVLGEATNKRKSTVSKKKPSQVTEQDMLLDLMGGSDLPATDLSATINGNQPNNADLLADILGGDSSGSTSQQQPPQANGQHPKSNVNSIMDLFNSPSPSGAPAPSSGAGPISTFATPPAAMSSPPPANATPPVGGGPAAHPVYNKNNLQITFQLRRDQAAIQVLARFRNTGDFENFNGVNLQAAVPKSQRLQLQGISSSDLSGGDEATQQMRITGVNGVCRLPILQNGYSNNSFPATTAQAEITVENKLFCWGRSAGDGASGLG